MLMSRLTDAEKKTLCALIETGQPLPDNGGQDYFRSRQVRRRSARNTGWSMTARCGARKCWRRRPPRRGNWCARSARSVRTRTSWRNLLVWGDNLLALRELLADQQGPNRFGTRGKIRLIYIDPPFATRQDFMKDKEKAYRDKVLGAQFIEFLRRRLILLREFWRTMASFMFHLDGKKVHYIKAVMDEVFDETNFGTKSFCRTFRLLRRICNNSSRRISSLNVRS